MGVIGLDIGNKFAYMSVLDDYDSLYSGRSPEKLVHESYPAGIPTDAMVHPDGFISVAAGISSNGRKPVANKRMIIGAVKNMLDIETIDCENSSGDKFSVSTGSVFSAIIREMICHANKERSRLNKSPIYDVLLAIPAKFYDNDKSQSVMGKIRCCVESIEIDGHKINLIDTIPEPAAAAIDFLHFLQFEASEDQRIKEFEDKYTAVVFDIGHGTFDTALVTADTKDYSYHLYHQDGLFYGGNDMDHAIFELFVTQAQEKIGNTNLVNLRHGKNKETLIRIAQEAKVDLTTQEEFEQTVDLPEPVSLRITRDQFEEMIEYDIENSVKMLQTMFDYAKKNGIHIDIIVMTGGCSHIPYIQKRVEKFAKEKNVPYRFHRPSKAVSFGASFYAASREMLKYYTGYVYSLLLDKNGHYLQEVVSNKQKLPLVTKDIELINQYDDFWIVRNIDKNDPFSDRALEDYKRLVKFHPDIPVGEKFYVRLALSKEYLFSIETLNENKEPLTSDNRKEEENVNK